MIRSMLAFALFLSLSATAQDSESPNLKPAADIAPAAVEADRKGWAHLEQYKKDYKDRALLESAVEEFKKAERLAGKPFALAMYHLGIAYQHTEEFKEAKRKLERCLELNPNFHEAMLELADTYAWLKSYDAAIKTYDKAIAMKPGVAAHHRNKAIAHMRKNDFVAAQKCVDESLKIDAKDDFALGLKKIIDKEVEGPKFATEFRKESAHFIVTSNVDQPFTDFIARHVELIYAKYESIFPKMAKPKEKHRVIVFNTNKEYMDYGSPQGTGGYFMELTKKLVFWKQPKNDDTLLVLYHETFHQFLSLYLDHAPQWFNEGHGDYFGGGVYDEKARKLEIRPNPWRLQGIQQGIRSGKIQPVAKLMQMTQQEMYDKATVGMNYAQAWSLVYFFWHYENGKYGKLLVEYFRALMKEDGDIKGAYDAVFAKQDMGKIESEWKDYTLKLRQ